jgi:hypothetical protein
MPLLPILSTAPAAGRATMTIDDATKQFERIKLPYRHVMLQKFPSINSKYSKMFNHVLCAVANATELA